MKCFRILLSRLVFFCLSADLVLQQYVEGFLNTATLRPSPSPLQTINSRPCFLSRHAVVGAVGHTDVLESSSLPISVASIDPVQAFTDTISGILNSPAILLIPIGAAVTLASLVAFFIVSYANPTEDSDETDFDDDGDDF